ncbi:MAG: FkbM family methyltransferase [Spirochaetaceae bacterium]|jgi:FkbM family methyltransferase|nr:FkbM family methyltransferase [Spirochaetaceae bacterium]
MSYFKSKFLEQASHNRLLKSLWQLVPYSMRFHVYQRFSLISNDTKHLINKMEKLTKVLIEIFEKEPDLVAGIEKKEEVLKFLKKNKLAHPSPEFLEIWLQKDSGAESVFNFNGAIFPRLSNDDLESFQPMFPDTFLFSLFFNDNYSSTMVERLESLMHEGPYGYTSGNFDVTVKADDTVIDAGAWVGDFSAYAAARGASAYAFEPSQTVFNELQKTAALNNNRGGGGIYPVNKGLGDADGELELFVSDFSEISTGGTILKSESNSKGTSEKIKITTLDNFVHEQNLKKVDFIKADIEGAERDMLKGARGVLKDFAPKLALCTYHLPDDPQVLESLIKDANPKYRVKQISKKLFASVNDG